MTRMSSVRKATALLQADEPLSCGRMAGYAIPRERRSYTRQRADPLFKRASDIQPGLPSTLVLDNEHEFLSIGQVALVEAGTREF